MWLVAVAGGENGFNQAIELSADTLANVKFVQEKRLISKFFDEISQDTGKFVFGVKDTLACLEMGAVETLIVWEDLPVDRVTLINPTSGKPLYQARQPSHITLPQLHASCSAASQSIWECCECHANAVR